MKQDPQETIELQLFQTQEYPCSYLPLKMARSQMILPQSLIQTGVYNQLIHHSFRRSGLDVYRPHCDDCQECQPIRVEINQFTPNRSQKRAYKKWQHLNTLMRPLAFQAEHYELYQRYQKNRHAEASMAQDDSEQYTRFMLKSNVDSFLVEFRDEQDTLWMVSLIDRLDDGLSAVYTFYETDGDYAGLGTYNVLWQIHLAQSLQLTYLYLGYWVEHSPKMAYKAHFLPAQILNDGQWRPFQSNNH